MLCTMAAPLRQRRDADNRALLSVECVSGERLEVEVQRKDLCLVLFGVVWVLLCSILFFFPKCIFSKFLRYFNFPFNNLLLCFFSMMKEQNFTSFRYRFADTIKLRITCTINKYQKTPQKSRKSN